MSHTEKMLPSGNIPYQTVLDLHDLYLKQKHKVLSADLKTKEDTKSIWFELNAEMRNFLTEVLNDKDVSGLRVYFMAYPDKQTDFDGVLIPNNPMDVGQITIGLVTTSTSANGKHPDYPESSNNFKMLIAPPMNHGELCPQKCD